MDRKKVYIPEDIFEDVVNIMLVRWTNRVREMVEEELHSHFIEAGAVSEDIWKSLPTLTNLYDKFLTDEERALCITSVEEIKEIAKNKNNADPLSEIEGYSVVNHGRVYGINKPATRMEKATMRVLLRPDGFIDGNIFKYDREIRELYNSDEEINITPEEYIEAIKRTIARDSKPKEEIGNYENHTEVVEEKQEEPSNEPEPIGNRPRVRSRIVKTESIRLSKRDNSGFREVEVNDVESEENNIPSEEEIRRMEINRNADLENYEEELNRKLQALENEGHRNRTVRRILDTKDSDRSEVERMFVFGRDYKERGINTSLDYTITKTGEVIEVKEENEYLKPSKDTLIKVGYSEDGEMIHDEDIMDTTRYYLFDLEELCYWNARELKNISMSDWHELLGIETSDVGLDDLALMVDDAYMTITTTRGNDRERINFYKEILNKHKDREVVSRTYK